MSAQIEITALTKANGPLTKRIALTPDGSLHSDGSTCVMSCGTAHSVRFDGLDAFAKFIDGLASNQAIVLGTLRSDLPDQVEITTKKRAEWERAPGPDRPHR